MLVILFFLMLLKGDSLKRSVAWLDDANSYCKPVQILWHAWPTWTAVFGRNFPLVYIVDGMLSC